MQENPRRLPRNLQLPARGQLQREPAVGRADAGAGAAGRRAPARRRAAIPLPVHARRCEPELLHPRPRVGRRAPDLRLRLRRPGPGRSRVRARLRVAPVGARGGPASGSAAATGLGIAARHALRQRRRHRRAGRDEPGSPARARPGRLRAARARAGRQSADRRHGQRLFSADWDVFQNHAIIRRLEERHGYRFSASARHGWASSARKRPAPTRRGGWWRT